MSELEKNGKGVYGIFIDDELVYIGSTNSSFSNRFDGHLKSVQGKRKRQLVHYGIIDAKLKGQSVEMKILINVDILHYKGKRIDGRDIQAMEYALILQYKPKFNDQGVTEQYIFNARRESDECAGFEF